MGRFRKYTLQLLHPFMCRKNMSTIPLRREDPGYTNVDERAP
jgi:hypothetical protein